MRTKHKTYLISWVLLLILIGVAACGPADPFTQMALTQTAIPIEQTNIAVRQTVIAIEQTETAIALPSDSPSSTPDITSPSRPGTPETLPPEFQVVGCSFWSVRTICELTVLNQNDKDIEFKFFDIIYGINNDVDSTLIFDNYGNEGGLLRAEIAGKDTEEAVLRNGVLTSVSLTFEEIGEKPTSITLLRVNGKFADSPFEVEFRDIPITSP